MPDGVTIPTTYTVEDTITLPTPTKEGWFFIGWYENGTKVTDIAQGSTGNKTLTARWAETTYIETDASGAMNAIMELTGAGPHTVKVTGELTSTGGLEVALSKLVQNNSEARVILDLSGTTSLTSIGQVAFSGCTNLESVTIPSSVTRIGSQAFFICTSLKSVTIPSSVTSIGQTAFARCTSLASVEIQDGVKEIEEYAFQSCTSLKSVTIPSSVTRIGSQAFQGCTNLASMTVNATEPPSLGSGIINDCSAFTAIYVPLDSVAAYKWAAYWKVLADKIQAIPE